MLVFQQGAQKQAPVYTPKQQAAINKYNSAANLHISSQRIPADKNRAIQGYETALKDKNLPQEYIKLAKTYLGSLLTNRANETTTTNPGQSAKDAIRMAELDGSNSHLLSAFAYNMIIPVQDLIKTNPKKALSLLDGAYSLVQKSSEYENQLPPEAVIRTENLSCTVLLYKAQITESEAFAESRIDKNSPKLKALTKKLAVLVSEIEKIPRYMGILARQGKSDAYRDIKSSLSIISAVQSPPSTASN